jgi:fatty acid desaturase
VYFADDEILESMAETIRREQKKPQRFWQRVRRIFNRPSLIAVTALWIALVFTDRVIDKNDLLLIVVEDQLSAFNNEQIEIFVALIYIAWMLLAWILSAWILIYYILIGIRLIWQTIIQRYRLEITVSRR